VLPEAGAMKLAAKTASPHRRSATRSSRCRRSTGGPRPAAACPPTRPTTWSYRHGAHGRWRWWHPMWRPRCLPCCPWGTGCCGPRPIRGPALRELRALRWGAVDTAGGRVAVHASWDPKAGPVAPKTHTSRRTVSLPGVLSDLLLEERLRQQPADDEQLVFGAFHATALTAAPTQPGRRPGWRRGSSYTRRATPTPAS
jgi:integrase